MHAENVFRFYCLGEMIEVNRSNLYSRCFFVDDTPREGWRSRYTKFYLSASSLFCRPFVASPRETPLRRINCVRHTYVYNRLLFRRYRENASSLIATRKRHRSLECQSAVVSSALEMSNRAQDGNTHSWGLVFHNCDSLNACKFVANCRKLEKNRARDQNTCD